MPTSAKRKGAKRKGASMGAWDAKATSQSGLSRDAAQKRSETSLAQQTAALVRTRGRKQGRRGGAATK
eukprot:2888859-Pleurochrysis_carterae.AAC.2